MFVFEWVDLSHRNECVIVYKRKGVNEADDLLVVLNLTPVVRWDWYIEISGKEFTKEIFNSDAERYWGSGNVFNPSIRTEVVDEEEKKYILRVNLPALAGIVLK
ncbi:MAG TPA: alpha amylase C-terminal domain-containing protein [Flavisolibacter sp.]|nr:alpha amylase C-terminal domain-containing protein [Flavisolibacter sp.]